MMYGNYNGSRYDNNYRDGGYERGGGSYGRRGVPGTGRGRYRGSRSEAEDYLNDMSEHYGNYSESRDTYGAEQDSMKALEYMLESVCQFMDMLTREAGSQEEAQMIKKYARKIGDM